MRETKRINAYGKRPTRIIYISDDDDTSHGSPFKIHHISSENNDTFRSSLSVRKGRVVHKVHSPSASPCGSPKSANVLGRSKLKNVQNAAAPKRRPLVLKVANVPDLSSDNQTASSHKKVSRRKRIQPQPIGLTSESRVEPEAVVLPRLKPKAKPDVTRPNPAKRPVAKQQYLAPLLIECGQTTPHCFSTFIETFQFDDIHGRSVPAGLAFRKIGEASFSEVFAIGKVVLKIVPLRNEAATKAALDPDVDIPQESDTKDVLQEVVVTQAMGQMCPGFVKLLRAYVVIGTYPSLLLSLWDAFNDSRGSENIRPDVFPSTQAYALLVLPHGGPDLEAYTFPVKTGWRQACSIFWQTAKALATAEDLVSFEHRDLHWGQLLVEHTSRNVVSRAPARRRGGKVRTVPMDDPSHNVNVTIIDLGLARMDARDGAQNRVYWTRFDELIFEGEGDYQFDLYRMMQRLHGDTWDQYRPLTNVMWLHYLLSKLLHAKRLRPPAKRGIALDGEFNEKQCYECLLDVEQRLGSSISQTKVKKGRGGAKGVTFCKAGDVVEFAKGRGWVT